tara:strand:+ start:3210 stop:3950 length:741 start_codon:yes stop_codon:yes gene_type:complete
LENENNISQELLETIERYIKDTMSSEEKVAFETQLKENPQLRQQVDDTQLLISSIRKAALKERLNEVHEDLISNRSIPRQNPKVLRFNFRTVSIAASILILIGGFWFFNQRPNNEKLFDRYFEPDRGLATVMSTTKNYEFDDAMVDYKAGKYDLAIKKWKKLLPLKPENDTLNYFLGVAHLANKKEAKAIQFLNKIIEIENGSFTDDSYYYLGLAQLKLNNIEAAKENLEKSNSPKSKKIISELNK